MVQLMGDDPWPYGIGPNRKALEALVEGAHDQELVGRRYQVEELFAPNLPEGLR
jgi:4,5-dihydroxyphthalate decarboxylase